MPPIGIHSEKQWPYSSGKSIAAWGGMGRGRQNKGKEKSYLQLSEKVNKNRSGNFIPFSSEANRLILSRSHTSGSSVYLGRIRK